MTSTPTVTVPREPTDEMLAEAVWELHAMHAVLFEMFRSGPVDVAFAGNPVAVESLKERTFSAIEAFEARLQREHEDQAA